MRRRALLTLSGGLLAGTAGCLSAATNDGERSPTETANGTASPPATQSPTESPSSVSVTLDALQPVVLYLATDAIQVNTDSGQYLFLTVSASGENPPQKTEFSFHFDGHKFAPFDGDARDVYRAYGDSEYDAKAGTGWMLFDLPSTGSATDAHLAWPGGTWHPDEMLRHRLEAPAPPLAVSTSFPDEVAVGDASEISLRITNDGELPGRFVAGLNRSGPRVAHRPVARVSVAVPAGKTVTHQVIDDELTPMNEEDVGDSEPDLTYYFHWENGDQEKPVRLIK